MGEAEADRLADGDTDVELTRRALAGEQDAFAGLYRRHADAAWRVARAVAVDPDDAADAVSDAFTRVLAAVQQGRYAADAPFRPYLLATTRNAAIDGLRRRTRAGVGDVIDLTERGAGATRWGHDHAGEAVVEDVDRALVASAFRSLPDRWRAVLWLTEVEEVPPREAATMLGISPNGVAQLAVRARAGLRARYLQAHLGRGEGRDEECRRTIRHLGAYVAVSLAPRDVARVDQHLAGCPECQERVQELRDVRGSPGLVAIPLPMALLGASTQRWRSRLASTSTQSPGSAAWFAPRGRLARAAGGWAAGVFAVGVLSLPDWGSGGSTTDEARAGTGPPSGSAMDEQPASTDLTGSVDVQGTTLLATPPVVRPPASRPPGGGDDAEGPTPTPPADDGPPPQVDVGPAPPPAPPETAQEPVVQVAVGAGVDGDGVALAVAVGGGCSGVTAVSATAGCATAPPEDTGVTASTGGSAVPAIELRLP